MSVIDGSIFCAAASARLSSAFVAELCFAQVIIPSIIVAATSETSSRRIHLRCSAVAQTICSRLANTPSRRLSSGDALAASNIASSAAGSTFSTGLSPTNTSRRAGSSEMANSLPRSTSMPSISALTT